MFGPTLLLKKKLFLNIGSLHLHIDNVRSDYNIQKPNVSNFVKSKLCLSDRDDVYDYERRGFTLYRNDLGQSNISTCYVTAVKIKKCFELY